MLPKYLFFSALRIVSHHCHYDISFSRLNSNYLTSSANPSKIYSILQCRLNWVVVSPSGSPMFSWGIAVYKNNCNNINSSYLSMTFTYWLISVVFDGPDTCTYMITSNACKNIFQGRNRTITVYALILLSLYRIWGNRLRDRWLGETSRGLWWSWASRLSLHCSENLS